MCHNCAGPIAGPLRSTRSCTDIKKNNCEGELSDVLAATYSHVTLKVPIICGVFEREKVLVWRLPLNFSQSRFAGRNRSSTACTMISLTMGHCIHSNRILFPNLELSDDSSSSNSFLFSWRTKKSVKTKEFPCPGRLLNCVANAILEGNDLHEEAIRKHPNINKNFTIPQALHYSAYRFRELDFCSVRGPVRENVPAFLLAAIQNDRLLHFEQIFFLLIIAEQCSTFVYQKSGNIIGFFDSHIHPPHGALIACTTLSNVREFSNWLFDSVFTDIELLDGSMQSFELSAVCPASYVAHLDEDEDLPKAMLQSDCTEVLHINSSDRVTKRKSKKGVNDTKSIVYRHQIFPLPTSSQMMPKDLRLTVRDLIRQKRKVRMQRIENQKLRRTESSNAGSGIRADGASTGGPLGGRVLQISTSLPDIVQ